jgi:hypothetical protein
MRVPAFCRDPDGSLTMSVSELTGEPDGGRKQQDGFPGEDGGQQP